MDGSARTDRTDLDRHVRERLAERGDVAFAYLFGSRAKGTARPDSDVDLAVHFGTDGGRGTDGGDTASVERKRTALDLEGVLEHELGRRVQVVVLEDAPPGLTHNVLSTGQLVFCRDDEARSRFFVDHCRLYFDMEPARRIFDRYRLRRLEEGTFGGRERGGS
ncbi:MAG: nucleotidyltransferase domain-containing protein [Candidatus Palauibacterales bacterium]|nr:nucleotidyltransferase domain-containing protein [Candidatus Palauibacterales bacterium]